MVKGAFEISGLYYIDGGSLNTERAYKMSAVCTLFAKTLHLR